MAVSMKLLNPGRSPTLGYGVAALSIAVVALIRLLVSSILHVDAAPRFLLFVLAAMFSGWYGGLGPGLLATALAAVAAAPLFLEPVGPEPSNVSNLRDMVEAVMFCCIGVMAISLNGSLKSELTERRRAEQTSRAQTQAMVEVSERLAQEHDSEQLQGLVLAAIVNQLEATGGELWDYNEDTDIWQILLDCQEGRVGTAAAAGHPLAGQQIGSGEFPGWKELKASYLRGECLQIPDLNNDSVLVDRFRTSLLQRGAQSALGVPMLLQGRLVGSYTVWNSRPTDYNPRELQLALALAHQATLAIQLSRLAEQARQTAVLEERNRMAREIHDTLAQAFTGILAQLGAVALLASEQPEGGQIHLQKARDLAREGLAEARRSVQALRPQALEKEDLVGALERMTEQLSADHAVRIEFRLTGTPRALPPDVADHLLRIGQEALTNALQHAQASEIWVELTFVAAELRLRVTDDGQGFPVDAPRRKEGFGLTGMQERARLIDARLAVSSQPDRGTQVEVTWRFPPGEA